MKSVLELNILFGNPSDALHRKWSFKIINVNCHKILKPFKTTLVLGL